MCHATIGTPGLKGRGHRSSLAQPFPVCGILRSVNGSGIVLSIAIACLGCGSGSGGTSITTSGAGTSIVANTVPTLSPMISVTAHAAEGVQGAGSGDQITVEMINLAQVPDVCALATSNQSPASSFVLLLILGTTTEPVSLGQYAVGTTLDAAYVTDDANCQATTPVVATAGTVDLTRADSSFTGSFDVTFPTGQMAGSFEAPLCSAPGNGTVVGDGGVACVEYPACDAQGRDGGPCLP
jgi:hypothetical protein